MVVAKELIFSRRHRLKKLSDKFHLAESGIQRTAIEQQSSAQSVISDALAPEKSLLQPQQLAAKSIIGRLFDGGAGHRGVILCGSGLVKTALFQEYQHGHSVPSSGVRPQVPIQ